MKNIIHAYQIKPLSPEKILSGETKDIILKGYYILPVYALNQGIVELLNKEDETIGYAAIERFTVLAKDAITEEEISKHGFSPDEFDLYAQDEDILTLVSLIPVIDNEEGCDCEDCDCKK